MKEGSKLNVIEVVNGKNCFKPLPNTLSREQWQDMAHTENLLCFSVPLQVHNVAHLPTFSYQGLQNKPKLEISSHSCVFNLQKHTHPHSTLHRLACSQDIAELLSSPVHSGTSTLGARSEGSSVEWARPVQLRSPLSFAVVRIPVQVPLLFEKRHRMPACSWTASKRKEQETAETHKTAPS